MRLLSSKPFLSRNGVAVSFTVTIICSTLFSQDATAFTPLSSHLPKATTKIVETRNIAEFTPASLSSSFCLYSQVDSNSKIYATTVDEVKSGKVGSNTNSCNKVAVNGLTIDGKPTSTIDDRNKNQIDQEHDQKITSKVLVTDRTRQRFFESARSIQHANSATTLTTTEDDKIPVLVTDTELYSIPFSVIWERTVDTLEDVYMHARRLPHDKGWLPEPKNDEQSRPTLLVLGSGWGAHALLKVVDTYKWRVIVCSPQNHFVFTPLLASAAVGTVEYRSMTEAVRATNPMIEDYIEGKAVDIDVLRQVVKIELKSMLSESRNADALSAPIEIHYDKLVVAVGCKVNDSFVKGAAEYCYKLKSCDDARRLRKAIGESLEQATRPDVIDYPMLTEQDRDERRQKRRQCTTFCVVGGGPSGTELVGELVDFVKDITKPRVGVYKQLNDDIRIILVEAMSELVPQFDKSLRKHVLESLINEGVEVKLDTYVNEVGDGFIRLKDKHTGIEETILTKVVVWAAGTAPVPFVSKLLEQLQPETKGIGGKINVDPWLRSLTPNLENFGNVFVMGDAASCCAGNKSYLPQNAQVASQQGAYIGRLLNREYDLSTTPPKLNDSNNLAHSWLVFRGLDEAKGFDFLNLGLLAYVGSGEALSQIEIGNVPIISYAGCVGFVLWRSVYLVKQVATRNRILVLFDWLKCRLFGRDITRL